MDAPAAFPSSFATILRLVLAKRVPVALRFAGVAVLVPAEQT